MSDDDHKDAANHIVLTELWMVTVLPNNVGGAEKIGVGFSNGRYRMVSVSAPYDTKSVVEALRNLADDISRDPTLDANIKMSGHDLSSNSRDAAR